MLKVFLTALFVVALFLLLYVYWGLSSGSILSVNVSSVAIPTLPEPVEIWVTRRVTVRAYCPNACCCGIFADDLTASGLRVTNNGGRLVASSFIPFGRRVIIPGYGEAVSADRGPRAVDKIEVLFKTHEEAKAWGVKLVDVEIEWMSDDHF